VFSSIDLQNGYHQVALQESDIKKTAFRTPLGHFECLVLWEGLCNAPSIFQSIMQKILRPCLGKFAALYLDDIVIYSKSVEEHAEHLEQILKCLQKHNFKAKLSKCEFSQAQLQFLGHVINAEGSSMDPAKVKVVRDWPVPTTYAHIRSFLGLCNYFSRYIPNYTSIAKCLHKIQNAKGKFGHDTFGTVQINAFNALKNAVLADTCLKLPNMKAACDGTEPFTVQVDASDDGMGGVLLQTGRPVAFFSKQFSQTESRFHAGDREMCAIIFALKQWRCYIEGPVFHLLTDHEPLIYFENISMLDRRKSTYLEFLSRFRYQFAHYPGVKNVVADCLSRHPNWSFEHAPKKAAMPGDQELHAFGTVNVLTRSGQGTSDECPYVLPTRHNAFNTFPALSDALPQIPDTSRSKRQLKRERKRNADAEKAEEQQQIEENDADNTMQDVAVEEEIDTNTTFTTDMTTVDEYACGTEEASTGMSPLLQKILLAYGTDPNFQKKAFTKKYKKTASGFYLIPGQPKLMKTPADEDAELKKADYTMAEYEYAQIVIPDNAELKEFIISHCHTVVTEDFCLQKNL
jgi:hypothetical protein